jgi:hypothetical protein
VTSATDTPEIGAVKDAYRAAIQAECSQVFNSISGGDKLEDVIQRFRVGVTEARLARDSVLAVLADM